MNLRKHASANQPLLKRSGKMGKTGLSLIWRKTDWSESKKETKLVL